MTPYKRGKESPKEIATVVWEPARPGCDKDLAQLVGGTPGAYNTPESNKVRLVDARNIVREHNDVEDMEMADLMLHFIRELD